MALLSPVWLSSSQTDHGLWHNAIKPSSSACTSVADSSGSVNCVSMWTAAVSQVQGQKGHLHADDVPQRNYGETSSLSWSTTRRTRDWAKATVHPGLQQEHGFCWSTGSTHPYSSARKSMKWYKKLAFHLLQVDLLNALILYSKSGGDKTFLQFSHDVIADLILSGDIPPMDKVESVVRLTEWHFPEKLQLSATWTKPQARCRVCYKKSQWRHVTTICHKCSSKPRLCTVPCFEMWHTKLCHWE